LDLFKLQFAEQLRELEPNEFAVFIKYYSDEDIHESLSYGFARPVIREADATASAASLRKFMYELFLEKIPNAENLILHNDESFLAVTHLSEPMKNTVHNAMLPYLRWGLDCISARTFCGVAVQVRGVEEEGLNLPKLPFWLPGFRLDAAT